MSKQFSYFKFLPALLFVMLTGCGGGGGGSTPSDSNAATAQSSQTQSDSIEILSVTPNAVAAGNPTTFTVTVKYTLATKDAGIVYLGFNTEYPATYHLATENVLVSKGTGTASITTTVTPVYYASPDAFAAYVNLSEHAHAEQWSPLADSVQNIDVTGQAQTPTFVTADVPIDTVPTTFITCTGGQKVTCTLTTSQQQMH